MNTWENVEYIGDGVYIKSEGIYFVLMANDHLNPTDKVYLDEHTFKCLLEYVKLHSSWLNEEQ